MNSKEKYKIGMVGLGVMGRNLLLNMADHGFSVAGYDNDPTKVEALRQEAGKNDIHCTGNLQEFISILQKPRAIILLVPAGAPVDEVIKEMLVYLLKDDLIIDAGNSYFKDTNLRTIRLQENGIHFMGMGISGGEEGARHGPSMMPGGAKEPYERVKLIQKVFPKLFFDIHSCCFEVAGHIRNVIVIIVIYFFEITLVFFVLGHRRIQFFSCKCHLLLLLCSKYKNRLVLCQNVA